jgi:hypothetical protein
MPAFPHMAEPANLARLLKFLAEVLWWIITAGWLLLRRAPRWLRIVLSIWFCIWLLSRCGRDESRSPEPAAQISARERDEAIKATVGQLAALGEKAGGGSATEKPNPLFEIGSQIARSLATEIKLEELKDKSVVAVPFAHGVADPLQAEFLTGVLTPLYGRLAVARAGETGLVTELSGTATADALAALGRRLNAGHVLGAELTTGTDGAFFTVRLVKTLDASVAWTARYPVAGTDPAGIAAEIAAGVLSVVPE